MTEDNMPLTKAEYIAKSLSKIKHTPWELYVISRIIHRLDNLDIECKCQQLVKIRDNHAFVDLFFPQIEIYLEIDEPHHANNQNAANDYVRSQEIFDATNFKEYRIKLYRENGGAPVIKETDEINGEIDNFVKEIKNIISTKEIIPWDIESKYAPIHHKERGYISLNGPEAVFLTHRDVLRCFGYQGGHHQRGAWRIPGYNNISVWFPKLFNQGHWKNEISEDGTRISEKDTDNPQRGFDKAMNDSKYRVVFSYETDVLGTTLYKFKGLFQRNDNESSRESGVVYDRISECVELPIPATER